MTEFLTLAHAAEHREDVKGSVFLAFAERADTSEEALAFLAALAQRYSDATHLCWAYRIGSQYRFSDAGEPGGTAGQPILRAIEGQGLDHVVAAVVRYFGGTKLGAGGLVRAYGGVVAEALRGASKRTEWPKETIILEVPFEHTGSLYHILEVLGVGQRTEEYGEQGIRLTATLPRNDVERLRTLLREGTRGDFRLTITE